MRRFFSACLLLALPLMAACTTPGYDYRARMVPTFPEAAAYRDVQVGQFRGPAGNVAEEEFARMLDDVVLDGAYWFGVGGPGQPQGLYEGYVEIENWEGETRFERDRKCVEYDAPFDCEHRAIVETECTEETVEVIVTARLVDRDTGRVIFSHNQGGGANQESCVDIREYEDDGRELGVWRDPIRSSYDPRDAPYGMIADATVEAVRRFRTDIAPYDATVRAEIMTEGLIPEEQNDPRFAAAVKATKRGEMLGACAQWDELGRQWPDAPAVLHNLGACAEARGDMETAQLRYARAADIASHIPLLKDKKARPIFDALERVSGRRMDDTFLDNVTHEPDWPMKEEDEVEAGS
ncbi:hypothetical protein [Hyphomonas sp.]|uniref:hypothetical protein n=1 Tax=Hyphomonas sp. TaxID=87 RepID=UPI000C56EEB8|nr:hypothetical protein [Hyphomonas sp.]MAB10291.1 hypothetical protein [Hyphomonas sp.]MAU67472.1 hypothetical protein [Hyphomonas sp.]MBM56656.1 hypothetical protein [Hyphomonas sp.]